MHSLSLVRSAVERLGLEPVLFGDEGNFAFRVGQTEFHICAFNSGNFPATDGKGRTGGRDTIVIARKGAYDDGPTDYLIGADHVIRVLKEDVASALVFQGS